MQHFMSNATAIEPADGTSNQEYIVDARRANGFSAHLVTTGTLTGATGWTISGSNGPNLDNSTSSGPDTTTFDWVDLGLSITNPSGSATNQLIIASDWRGRWLRIKWDSTSATGSGNVAVAVHLKGTG